MEYIEPAFGQAKFGLNASGEIVAQVAGGFFTGDLAQRWRRRSHQDGELILVGALPGETCHQIAQVVAPDFFGFHAPMVSLFSKKVNPPPLKSLAPT
ncbi:hypothetical protein D3C76_1500870 [compost metagenome]